MVNPLKYNISTRFRSKLINEELRATKEMKILDVGCGIGYMAEIFSKRGFRNVFAMDISVNSLKFASKRNPKALFVVGDVLKLPYKDNSFDCVVTSEVMEHVKDGNPFVKELSRITKPGGQIILTTPSIDGILNVSRVCHSHGSEIHYKIGFSRKELVPMFKRNNLKVLKVRYSLNFFTQIWMEMAKLAYTIMNPKFEEQAELNRDKKSFIFKVYKHFFFIAILLMKIDSKLEKPIKGSNIMIVARKPL